MPLFERLCIKQDQDSENQLSTQAISESYNVTYIGKDYRVLGGPILGWFVDSSSGPVILHVNSQTPEEQDQELREVFGLDIPKTLS